MEPPEPAVMVADVLYPSQIVEPLAGVATFKIGLTVADDTDQVQIVTQAVLEHP